MEDDHGEERPRRLHVVPQLRPPSPSYSPTLFFSFLLLSGHAAMTTLLIEK